MKRKIPFVRQFKKNDELDALTARLSLLYRNGLYETKSVPKEFFAILKTGDGAKLKSYLAPYVDKMKGEKTIQYYNRCYLENESDRCYIAAVIIIFKL